MEKQVMYVLCTNTNEGEHDVRLFRKLDSAKTAFYAEVGRLVFDERDAHNEISTSIKMEYGKMNPDYDATPRIAYYATEGYGVEVSLLRMEVEE